MIRGYKYILKKLDGGSDIVNYIVNCEDDGQARNKIQSHYASNRGLIGVYGNGKHLINISEIVPQILTHAIVENPNTVNL